jgi:GlcNAc-P-P-Und epimerase
MKKVLVTGGSGFIGTNYIQSLSSKKVDVLNLDIKEPQNKAHLNFFRKVDILDLDSFTSMVNEFKPSHIVHLAARTDLDGKRLSEYKANIDGVKNLIEIISKQKSIRRCLFTSTKSVCKNGYNPKSDDEYCPDTLYGESKVIGEKLVRESLELQCEWCIVRPTSIWGPWFNVPPYKGFFLSISKGLYFHPGKIDPPKNFGYVGNIIYQLNKLIDAPKEIIHKGTFYLADYKEYSIKTWANIISIQIRNKEIKTIPEWVIKLVAKAGDLFKKLGYEDPPITSFRLKNIRTDTSGTPCEPTIAITGPLPYTMEKGVEQTIGWLREKRYIM